MRIRCLFFAAYRERIGAASLEVDLEEGTTVSGLVSSLRERGGRFSCLPAEPSVALNREYASLDELLGEGDEVAFIPPVAGG